MCIRDRGFVVRKLGQKKPYSGVTNVITVTLAINVDLVSSDFSKITLQGLTGAATPDTGSLAISDDAITVSSGLITDWDTENPRSKFTLSLLSSLQAGSYVGFLITVTTGDTIETRNISGYDGARQVTLDSALTVNVTAQTTYACLLYTSDAADE